MTSFIILQSDAMQIVKTIGQAFEVCHQIQLQQQKSKSNMNSTDVSPCRTTTSSVMTASTRPADQSISSSQSQQQPVMSHSHTISHPETFQAASFSYPNDEWNKSTNHGRIKKSVSELGAGAAGRNALAARQIPTSISGRDQFPQSQCIYSL